MTVKVETLQEVRLNARDIPAGVEIDIDSQLVGPWERAGLARVVQGSTGGNQEEGQGQSGNEYDETTSQNQIIAPEGTEADQRSNNSTGTEQEEGQSGNDPEGGTSGNTSETPTVSGEEQKSAEEFPKHTGGGVYLLSDGSKVKGKEAALKAQNALAESGGDENDTENDNSATDGTGYPGGGESAS